MAAFDALSSQKATAYKYLVSQYISRAGTIHSLNIRQAKHLLDIAHRMTQSGKEFDHLLFQTYRFSQDAIAIAHEAKGFRKGETKRLFEAIFSGYKSDVAYKLFKKGKFEAIDAFYDSIRAAELFESISKPDLQSAAFHYKQALTISRRSFQKSDDSEWLMSGYDSGLKAAQAYQKFEPAAAVYCYAKASEYAHKLYKRTKEVQWAEKSFSSRVAVAELTSDYNPEYSIHSRHIVADMSRRVYEATHDTVWRDRAISSYEKVLEGLSKFTSYHDLHAKIALIKERIAKMQ